jgi:hypothetical protein
VTFAQVAIENFHRRSSAGPYELLCNALIDGDIMIKTSIVTFFNSFIMQTADLDERVTVSV